MTGIELFTEDVFKGVLLGSTDPTMTYEVNICSALDRRLFYFSALLGNLFGKVHND